MSAGRDITAAAGSLHKRFSGYIGGEHIASLHALHGLMWWVLRRRPSTILEVGAGIGTLTSGLLWSVERIAAAGAARPILISTEDNAFCVQQIAKNLADQLERFHLISDMDAFPQGVASVEFVVIDGGVLDERYFTRLAPRGVVFFEGFREKQRKLLESTVKGRSWVQANFRSRDRREGYWIYQLEPTFWERIWFGARNLGDRIRLRVKLLLGNRSK
ncbi:MAG: hypothetical protein ACP5VE_05260 [Chthonomonadales bacterium]